MEKDKVYEWYAIIERMYQDGSFDYWHDEVTGGELIFDTIESAREALEIIKESCPEAEIVKESRQIVR
jgi:hypothetical protein